MLTERPSAATINRDSPELRAALGELAALLARQLAAVADDLAAGRMTAWQGVKLAARLDRLEQDVSALRREAAKLMPAEESP